LYQEFERRPIHAKFKTGDKVRILKKKGFFEKGFTPNWTEKCSQFQKFKEPTQLLIKITDYNGEGIQGTFYEQELQKTS